jgi:hypothetical protein
MTFCGNPLSRSLLGAKRTCTCAVRMSAKQTSDASLNEPHLSRYAAALIIFLGRQSAFGSHAPVYQFGEAATIDRAILITWLIRSLQWVTRRVRSINLSA